MLYRKSSKLKRHATSTATAFFFSLSISYLNLIMLCNIFRVSSFKIGIQCASPSSDLLDQSVNEYLQIVCTFYLYIQCVFN